MIIFNSQGPDLKWR